MAEFFENETFTKNKNINFMKEKEMTKQEADVLNAILQKKFVSQRKLSETTGYSAGTINKALHELRLQGYMDANDQLTEKSAKVCREKSPQNAIILAAGVGLRMIPINAQQPKALIEVKGEILIERLIKQLHTVGITEIYIVVGFMKEEFEYLIDEYGVNLIVNEEYSSKNNLHSLFLASPYLKNSYIVPCDIWCNKNPFNKFELYSWYMVNDKKDKNSDVRVNRKQELVSTRREENGNGMVGIAYLTEEQSRIVKKRLEKYNEYSKYDEAFWEETLYEKGKMLVWAKTVSAGEYTEINTYEQLRELDKESNNLKTDAINEIVHALNVKPSDIIDIRVLKKGMTNRSFLFQCKGKNFIMRIPGEGTEHLINRREESDVYRVLKGRNICDNIVYINSENGYKITEFLEEARVCAADNEEDVNICIKKLREFHNQKLIVNHEFDIFKQMEFYENLWNGKPSIFRDYFTTKKNVLELREYIDAQEKEKCLTHIDAVPDNFLIMKDGQVRLIDWEYAGMQDPHVDIAMFCIYSLYDREQTDRVINIYFNDNCPEKVRIKIYCYIAACGLLWSNWCEYKRNLGVEFGEYSLRQYRYAKEYYRIVKNELGGIL